MERHRIPLLVLVLLLALGLTAGCSDDDDPAGPGGETDTTAPQVVSVDPPAGQTGVAVDEQIVIVFSEDMDTATGDGAITLSTGAVTDLTWTDARTVVVDHPDWAEGAAVTLTVGTGLTDLAGNALAADHAATFYVETSELVFLGSDPADGATDVNRSTVIALLFSAEMNTDTFTGAVALTDAGQNPLGFQVHEGEGSWVIVDPDADLPADQTISLTISTDVQDHGGRNLAQPVALAFTTGQDVDTTPPTIVSFEPATDAVIDETTTFFRVTFSEPVIPDSADPIRVNAELFWLVEQHGGEPTWSPDYTVWTVPLPAPLPAGLPMELTFEGYQDLAGNAQPAATTWTATVDGTPDYYPLEDARRYAYDEYGAWGNLGEDTPQDEWTDRAHVQFDAQGGGVYHRTWYDPGYTTPYGWDVMQQAGGALEYLGFAEVEGGQTMQIDFASPLTFTTLPPAGTWTDQTTASIPGEGTMTLVGEGRFVSEQDVDWLPGGHDHPGLFWKDVRLVVIDHTISAGDALVETGVDSLWLSPTVGIIRYATYNEDDAEWDYDTGTLLPPDIR